MSPGSGPGARERILDTAYELFSQRGVRSVGVDELISRSGVANATFYRHFPSKDDLVLAFLRRKEQLWTMDTIVSKALDVDGSTRDQLLAIFDVLDEWFHRIDFAGDAFITVLIEMGPNHALGRASLGHLSTVRRMIASKAAQADIGDPEEFAWVWQILMQGAIIAARMGNIEAARLARPLAESVIDTRSAHRD